MKAVYLGFVKMQTITRQALKQVIQQNKLYQQNNVIYYSSPFKTFF